MLKKAKLYLLDGTFEVCPDAFSQVYIVLAAFEGEFDGEYETFPAAIALLKDRHEDTYDNLFSIILEQIGEHRPESVIADFETGVHTVARRLFDCTSYGCLFHLLQAWKRRRDQLGLMRLKQRDLEFNHFCDQIRALAYIPEDEVSAKWEQVKKYASGERLDKWSDYVLEEGYDEEQEVHHDAVKFNFGKGVAEYIRYIEKTMYGKWLAIIDG